jgi:flagellar basal-body rod protein FlgC
MTKYLMVVLLFLPMSSWALEDSLQKAIEVASQGNNIQSERLKIVAENLANELSTSDTPGGDPYRRKIMFVENKYDKHKKVNLLRVKKYAEDKSDFNLKYEPSHPAADINGYVKMPNISREIERSDASEAQRAYEANLEVIATSRAMMQKNLEVIR